MSVENQIALDPDDLHCMDIFWDISQNIFFYVPRKKVIQVWNSKKVMTELLLNYPFNVLIKPQKSSLTNHIFFHTLHEVNFSEGYLIIFKTHLTWGQLIEGGYPQSLQQIQRQ